MMNYHRNRGTKKAYIWLPIVIIALLALFTFTPVIKWSFDGLESAFLIKTQNAEYTKSTFGTIFNAKKYLNELKELRSENEKLEIELLRFEDDIAELSELREKFDLGFFERDVEITRVIMRPPWSGFDILIVERGENSQAEIGDMVTAHGSVALGRIVEILDKIIRVKMFTHHENQILGFLKPQDIEQELHGLGGSAFELDIAREIEIEEGDRIYMASNTKYLIGIVRTVIFDARDPYKTVLAVPPVNISHLQFVEIVK